MTDKVESLWIARRIFLSNGKKRKAPVVVLAPESWEDAIRGWPEFDAWPEPRYESGVRFIGTVAHRKNRSGRCAVGIIGGKLPT